ncbi:MAG: methyltransferase domain-containing protein [Candidatus Hydrogenedentota bacterium]|nr:MAG: methyltransferase domain-containing protein [Candidatus Hydrogenedentota bacterium]
MIDTRNKVERFLQLWRFKKIPSLNLGKVIDFGGNKGELRGHIKCECYTLVNYDHSILKYRKADNIVALAVIEHIEKEKVFEIFKMFNEKNLVTGGRVWITTPTPLAKPILEFLAFFNIVDKDNIREHKHYWTKKEIYELAKKTGFKIEKYKRFQFGFNQFAIFRKLPAP